MAPKRIALITTSFLVCAAALEGGFISFLRPLYDRGTTWPTLIFGILASVLLALGLLPPYFELAKRQGRVVGIHFAFLAIDMSGALFSALSVVVGNMDVMGIVLYCVCVALEVGIFLSHFIWCCRFKWFTDNPVVDEEKQIEADDNQESLEPHNDKNDTKSTTKEKNESDNEHSEQVKDTVAPSTNAAATS